MVHKSIIKETVVKSDWTEEDLSIENILATLSLAKKILVSQISSNTIELICTMSPLTKSNLLTAYRRTRSFGKTLPDVPCYNEYLCPISTREVLEKSGIKGITVRIYGYDDDTVVSSLKIILKNKY